MAVELIFNPLELKKLQSPFSFLIKTISKNKPAIVFALYSEDIIKSKYKYKEDQDVLVRLTQQSINYQRAKLKTHYHKLNLKKDEDAYIHKHLSDYCHKSFAAAFKLLSKGETLYHKTQIAEKRYRNLPCGFDSNNIPQLSFKLIRKGGALALKTYYEIGEKTFDQDEITRFDYLTRRRDIYYLLRKKDWELMEFIESSETFSYQEFTTVYLKRLRGYSLDMNNLFEREIREVIPENIIQISELGGDLLLFLPRWDYDGYILEDTKETFTVYKGKKEIVYQRNPEEEQKTIQFLQNAHPKFKGQSQFFLTFKEASAKNWFFNFYHNQLKDNFTITGMDMLGYFRYSEHQITSEFTILESHENLVTAKFTTCFGTEKIKSEVLQKAVLQDDGFVLLKDNSLGVLTEEWLNEYSSILKHAAINGEEIKFAKWLLLISSSAGVRQQAEAILPENWWSKWEQWNQSEEFLYDVPENLKAQLRSYQHKGYDWFNLMAEVNAGTLLADEMGLGKTVQAIGALLYWRAQNPKAKFLIVCPASLIYNWKNEFEKFVPSIPLHIYHGTERDIHDFLLREDQVLITSYSIIRNDRDIFSEIFWDAVVLDESHHIKNINAQQTRAVLELKSHRRIILNGTPIMNHIEELFPQLHFLLPQLFSSLRQFRNQFVKPLQNKNKEQAVEALRKLLQPFLLRRTKEIASPDLPQKTEMVMWCEMEADQREAYESIKEQVRDNLLIEIKDRGLNNAKLGVLQGISKLRQLCSSPHLLKDQPGFDRVSSVKIDQLVQALTTDLADEKVLVFSQFIGTIELLKEIFEENGISYRSFTGKTSVEERIQLVDEFQEKDSDIQVFLMSLKAGNSGINLTRANYVFLMEPWWNKAVQQQAIDRVHRIGQTQKVFAYNMICKDSIEEKIQILQGQKQDLSDQIITDEEGLMKNLSIDDIMFLFD